MSNAREAADESARSFGVLVFVGGGLGAITRYLLVTLFAYQNTDVHGVGYTYGAQGAYPHDIVSSHEILQTQIPILAINLAACFLVGIVDAFLSREDKKKRGFFITGFLGGFSTLAALTELFCLPNTDFANAASFSLVLINIIGGVICALCGGYLGKVLPFINGRVRSQAKPSTAKETGEDFLGADND